MRREGKQALVGLCGLLALGFGAASLEAQDRSRTTIAGRVSPAFRMDVAATHSDPHLRAAAAQESDTSVSVAISYRGAVEPGQVTVVLALRTNAQSYRLSAALRSGPAVTVEAIAPSPSGNGSQVAPGALTQLATSPGIIGEQERVIALGPRISQRGSFRSPDNAILLPVRIQIPASNTAEPIRITVRISS